MKHTLIEMKFDAHSLAIALASKVLPQPGGPHNNAPRDGCCPYSSKMCA